MTSRSQKVEFLLETLSSIADKLLAEARGSIEPKVLHSLQSEQDSALKELRTLGFNKTAVEWDLLLHKLSESNQEFTKCLQLRQVSLRQELEETRSSRGALGRVRTAYSTGPASALPKRSFHRVNKLQ